MLVPVLVRDVMRRPVETASPEAPVIEVAERLVAKGIGSVVIEVDGRPTGIVTRSDLVRFMATRPDDLFAERADECCSSPLVTVSPDDTIERAARTLRDNQIKWLPVVEDDSLVGIISTTDLSYYLPDCRLKRHSDEAVTREPDWEFEYEDERRPGLSVGDVLRFSKTLSEEDVERFAQASGDTNPLHLDDSFAAETRFGHRIVHGVLTVGVISAALARLPGLTIYLSQDISFAAPVDIGETVTAVCKVVEALGADRYRIETEVYDEDDRQVIDGEAVVLIDDLPEVAGDGEEGAVEANA